MLQDPNVERYIEKTIRPLKKEIQQMKLQIEELNKILQMNTQQKPQLHKHNVSTCTYSIGDRVRIIEGATDWMKKHNYWLEDMGQSIDGLHGQIVDDYSDLPNNDCHFSINIGLDFHVGVHPMWLILV